jgi:flagellar protein FliS
MLLDAGVRAIHRAKQLWSEGEAEQGSESLIRAQQIVTELLCGLNRDVDAELAEKVAAIYLFVFRTLMEANLKHDAAKLDDAAEVLEIERETWRQVCEKLGSSGTRPAGGPGPATPAWPRSPAIDLPSTPETGSDASTGFSLEA